MKILQYVAIGMAPGVLGAIANVFIPSSVGYVMMAVVYALGVACCFRSGFGIADQIVRSPGRNLIIGFLFSAVFMVSTVCLLAAGAAYRARSDAEYEKRQ